MGSISSGYSAFGGFLMAYFILLFVMLAAGIALYVLSSLGLYAHAKRHGIKSPWLAWIPVGNYWVYGKLSDLAVANKPGKKLNYTKWLMGLSVGLLGAAVLYFVLGIILAICAATGVIRSLDDIMGMFAGLLIFAILIYLVMYAASIALVVIWSIGMYHVYLLYCTKGVALTFAILGGVFYLHGIFLFAIRTKPLLPPQPQPMYYNVPPQGYYPPQR